MLRQYEDNDYSPLNKILKQEQNAQIANRIRNIKAIVNTKSPAIFNKTLKRQTKSQEQKDLIKNFDLRRNNMILYNKLYDIDKHGHQTILNSMKPVFRLNKSPRDSYVKNEVKKLAQENLFMLKRLLSKESEYSSLRLEKDYRRSQKYKRNICHYPYVNFHTSPNKNAPLVQGYNFNKRMKKIKKLKLPKIGGKTIKSAYRDFRTTHRTLDEKYYKEAKRSMNSTTRSKFKITKYSPKKKKTKM